MRLSWSFSNHDKMVLMQTNHCNTIHTESRNRCACPYQPIPQTFLQRWFWEVPCTSFSFLNHFIFYNDCTLPKSGSWQWFSMCLLSPLARYAQSLSQSRYRIIPSPWRLPMPKPSYPLCVFPITNNCKLLISLFPNVFCFDSGTNAIPWTN